jgi:cyanophycinase
MDDYHSRRNRIALSTRALVSPLARVRRPFAAALAAVCLTVLPTLVGGEPKGEPPPRAKDDENVGALVIVGGGGFPDDIRDRFLELAGGANGRLVVIPTASEQADRKRIYRSYAYWQKQGLASVSLLHTLDPKQANDPSFVKPIAEATAAWLGGGDQQRLADAYRGTAVERELRQLLARGGVIGGTSAGASVLSAVMITGGNPQARVGKGFGLLPNVVIDQHFRNRQRQKRLLGVLEKHPRCLGLGIDEETAVVVRGHTFTVLGKGSVSVCLPPMGGAEDDIKLLEADQTGDLHQLSHSILARLKTPAESKPIAATTSSRAITP